MDDSKSINVWDMMVREEYISSDQLKMAEKQAEETKESLQKVIIKLGILTEQELLKIFSRFYSVPILDLSTCNIKKEVCDLIPKNIASKYLIMPLFKIGKTLTVATSDPLNFYGVDHVQQHTQMVIKIVLCTESSLMKTLERYYELKETITVEETRQFISNVESTYSKMEWDDEAPIVQLVNNIMEQAVSSHASDIHIEPEEKFVRIRVRIDGLLYEVSTPPKELEAGIISRIKLMGGMNIAEKRKPQDGRTKINILGKEIDLRVSTIPTNFGENLVIRILDKSNLILPLEKLGFSSNIQNQWKTLIQNPHGIILVTGPTGSGKTTTLYSTINRLKTMSSNIVTLEDPIEYQMDIIRQMQVNPKLEITFSSGLRALLRQDPDIIMIGEVRDKDTAEIAIQAALTGHLVFSTLHTNDSVSALVRLMEMGIEPYLIASSVIGVLSQRLVRVLCPCCKIEKELLEDDLFVLGTQEKNKISKAWFPSGCKKCRNKGYSGRIGVFELLVIEPEIRKSILNKKSTEYIKKNNLKNMKSLFEDGLEKIAAGLTSVDELLRVSMRND